jgi:deoxyribodipyrimidine photo-lyase
VKTVAGESVQLHWHRRDLRAVDNRGLAAAASAGTVLPAFVLDDDVLAHAGPPRVRFLLDALADLRSWYRERGGDLRVVRGDPREELPALARERDVERVTWNRDYSGLARERDEAVSRALADDGVPGEEFGDALLHEPGSITTNAGEHYSVFSYFGRKWLDRSKDDPLPAPDPAALADAAGDPFPDATELGVGESTAEIPAPGREAARERLRDFCERGIFTYARDRDFPAREGTSRLSQDLKFGTLGVREVYRATERAMEVATGDESDGGATGGDGGDESDGGAGEAGVDQSDREAAVDSIEAFREQLAWREFYAHVLAADPGVVNANYREYDREIEWRDDPEGLRAWKEGQTGYPIVDAGMRQLDAEAWMHNRVRMIVASFLTKDLLVDWREGYAHFRERLVDHDPAADSGGWQWAASTGTDAQPYFRIFNPTTQGERYDPDATYVRRHVDELADVDPEAIHGWPELSDAERERIAPDYPGPIVEHADRREAAVAMFQAARGEEDE